MLKGKRAGNTNAHIRGASFPLTIPNNSLLRSRLDSIDLNLADDLSRSPLFSALRLVLSRRVDQHATSLH
jgi:hypothetical protein